MQKFSKEVLKAYQRGNVQKTNIQFSQTKGSNKDLIFHQGGTRSGKTYSIVQYIISECLDNNEDTKTISVVRKFLPSLKRSVYRDFLDILREMGLYKKENHNKSDLIYLLNGHRVEFFATGDEPERLRSAGRDMLYINEGLEIGYEEWKQLNFRTKGKIIVDYNPSEAEHFFYDLADGEDADLFVTTYRDNRFLPDKLVKEIEKLEKKDPTAWRVYGQGERMLNLKGKIYEGWELCESIPEGETFYGLDFGYHPDPTALIKAVKIDDAVYFEELMYNTKASDEDVKGILRNVYRSGEAIYCDHNNEQLISSLRESGFNARKAKKGAGSILEGINFLKGANVYVLEGSKNLWKEYKGYSWRLKKGFDPDQDGAYEQVPKKNQADHGLDSARYAYYSHYFTKGNFFVL